MGIQNKLNRIKDKEAQSYGGSAPSAYQANLANNYEADMSTPTLRSAFGKIMELGQTDKKRAKQAFDMLSQLQQNPSSVYYNPYATATNRSVANLQAMGINTGLLDDDWFQKNSYLKQYYIFDGTTNTPSKPGKKATAEQMAAYEYYQLDKSREDTKKAQQETEALKQELTYWAQRPDRNYSDDEILNKIDWNKYKTLAKMDETKAAGAPMELNTKVDYSKDWMYGVLWAARNDGGTGSSLRDMANSALGIGNTWQEDPELYEKINPKNKETYSPYSVGSTLEKEGLYFGMYSFDQEWLDNNWSTALSSNDKTLKEMYNKVYEAEQNTQAAESELKDLKDKVSDWLDRGLSEERILKKLEAAYKDYKTLAKMDKSLETGELIGTTRAIDYRKQDILNWIHQTCEQDKAEEENANNNLSAYGVGAVHSIRGTSLNDYTAQAIHGIIADGTDSLEEVASKNEVDNWFHSPFLTVEGAVKNVKEFVKANATATAKANVRSNARAHLYTQKTIEDYENAGKDIEKLETMNQKIEEQLGNKLGALSGGSYGSVDVIMNTEGGEVTATLVHGIDGEWRVKDVVDGKGNSLNEMGDEFYEMYGYLQPRLDAALDHFSQAGEWASTVDANSITAEDEALYELYEQNIAAITQKSNYLKNSQEDYNNAVAERDAAERSFNLSMQAMHEAGLDTTEMEKSQGILDIIMSFSQPVVSDTSIDNWCDDLMRTMYVSGGQSNDFKEQNELVTKMAEDIPEQIKDIQWLINYIDQEEIDVPEDYINHMQEYILELENRQKAYDYYQLMFNENFESKAADGQRLIESFSGRGQGDPTMDSMNQAANQMDDSEKQIYYYLYRTQGKNAASEYYAFLNETVLGKRALINAEEAAKELNETSPVLANAAAIAFAPVDAIAGAGWYLNGLINGKLDENSAIRTSQVFSTTVYSENMEAIANSDDLSDTGKYIAKILYSNIYNRGRSLVNSLVFGGFGGESEIVGAFPMAIGAAAQASAEAIERGANDGQALIIGLATFGSESVTEGIRMKHLDKALSAYADPGTFKEFLLELVPDMLAEMTGETLNEISEKGADYLVMWDKSEIQQSIENYKSMGYSQEEAESMTMQDNIDDVVFTAISSLLSPTGDTAFYAAGRVRQNYRYSQINKYVYGGQSSVRELRQADLARLKAEQEAANQPEEEYVAAHAKEETEEAKPTDEEYAPAHSSGAQAYNEDTALLDEAAQAKRTQTRTTTMAALLSITDSVESEEQATAAAVHLGDAFGEGVNAITETRTLVDGARIAGIEAGAVKQGIQIAALSASSQSRQVLQSQDYVNATPQAKAEMLTEAFKEDSKSAQVATEMNQTVFDNRVAEVEKQLISQGAAKAVEEADYQAKHAAEEENQAINELANRRADHQAKAETLVNAYQELADDSRNNRKRDQVTRAVNEVTKAATVAKEYEQSAQNKQQAREEAEAKATRVKRETMLSIRQQAEQIVAQQNVERAQAREQQIAEQAQADARADAAAQQAQAEADERSGLTEDRENEQKITDYVENTLGLKGDKAEAVKNRMLERSEQRNAGKVDPAQSVTSVEAQRLLGRLSRRLNVPIITGPLEKEGARGEYSDGKIYISDKLTVGQAMIETALHEVTHALEQTKNYSKYAKIALDAMYDSDEALRAAVRKKIEDYAEKGETLTEDGAKKELVAEFTRTKLADSNVVERLVDAGMGNPIKNALHNINQYLKNMKLKGQEKVNAEILRRAEREFQKAINQRQKQLVHPNQDQFSLVQFAQAAELYFDENTLELYDKPGGKRITKVTPEMIKKTPIGKLIELAETGYVNKGGVQVLAPTINRKTAQQARQLFADLMTMCANYKNSDLIWEIAGSTLYSSLKANSDTQYGTTVDFGTICAKTQEIVNVLGRVMMEKVKNGENGGLTRADVLKVYNETAKAGLTVPCPVCYVFSRWMGVPGLLGQMGQYQNDYVVTEKGADGKTLLDEDGNAKIDWKATQDKVNAYVDDILSKYGNVDNIADAENDLTKAIDEQEDLRVKAAAIIENPNATEEDRAAAKEAYQAAIDEATRLEKEHAKLESFNWIYQSLCEYDRVSGKKTPRFDENGHLIVDKNFRLTPDEILFNLNRTAEFAKYTKNWEYRNTRGSAMGKAIMPYSGASLGDVIHGTERWSAEQNPFLNHDDAKAAAAIKAAILRAQKQNLIGGQRLQSTSDFRPEWGLDYLMTYLEMQAIGSKVQMYTKVAEAVPLLASMGGDINLSIMGAGKGWHIDENGRMVLDFSDITGMPYELAKALKDSYDNVQMILVGMNDTHIRLALADSDIDFVIPWHSSGNTKDAVASMLASVKEHLDSSDDYQGCQSDKVSKNQTPEQKKLWDLRVGIINGRKMSEEELKTIFSDVYLNRLYTRFNLEGDAAKEAAKNDPFLKKHYKRFGKSYKDTNTFGIKLGIDQAKQIFPYEYWDTSLTKDQANDNGWNFVKYCQHFGIVPRFSGANNTGMDGIKRKIGNFSGAIYDAEGVDGKNIVRYDRSQMADGYWKLLIDRPMYNRDGTFHEQQVVDVTGAKVGHLENGKLVDSDIPTKTSAKYTSPKNRDIATMVAEDEAVYNSLTEVSGKKQFDLTGDFSVAEELTDAEVDQMLADAGADYESALERGDMDAAQKDVDFYAESNGYTLETFHGTGEYFNEFRRGVEGIHLGNREQAEQVSDMRYKARSEYTQYKWSDIRDSVDSMTISQRENLIQMADLLREDIIDPKAIPEFSGDVNNAEDIVSYVDRLANQFEEDGWDDDVATIRLPTFDRKVGNHLMRLYAKINNPFDINGDIRVWAPSNIASVILARAEGVNELDFYGNKVDISGSDITLSDQQKDTLQRIENREFTDDASWDALSDVLNESGFDGIKYLNTFEGDKNSSSYIALRQSDVKSADTVTYDDQGKPIPLDQRFNEESNDIRYSLLDDLLTDADIDQMLENMSPEELGLDISDTEEAKTVLTNAVQDLKQEFDPTIYNGKLYVKPETMQHWLSPSGFASTNKNYAQAYITTMDPKDYLRMTTATEEGQQRILDEATPLDEGRLAENAERQPIQLHIDEASGKVTGHEGRHRAVALARAGVTEMPVLLFDFSTKYDKTRQDEMTLQGQTPAFRDDIENGNTYTFQDVIPLSAGNADEITEKYTASEADQQTAAANQQRVLQYDLGDGEYTDADIDQMLSDAGLLFPGLPTAAPNAEPETRQRQFGAKLEPSDLVPEEIVQHIKDNSDYEVVTNREQVEDAMDWIRARGYQAAIREVTSEDFNYLSATGQARIATLMSMAARLGDTENQRSLMEAFNTQGTDIARALQVRNLFRMMTPDGREAAIRDVERNMNRDLYRQGKPGTVHLSNETIQEARNARTEKDFKNVQQHATEELVNQLPVTWKDRLQAWRMLSMLGNTRTHARNFFGNAIFLPVVRIKDEIGAGLEHWLIRGSAEEGVERTKAFKASHENLVYAKADAKAKRDLLTGEDKYSPEQKARMNRAIFGTKDNLISKTIGKALQKLSDANSKWLEKEDWFFLNRHYAHALAGWMTANHLTPEDMTGPVAQTGMNYAVQEALKATYRDASKAAETLNKLSRQGGFVGFVVEAALPFKKTPANILKRGVEYSPVGLIRALGTYRKKVGLYKAWQQGLFGDPATEKPPKNALSPTQAIDRLASGITGTAISVLGGFLASIGAVTVKLDDPEDELKKLMGYQEYSIDFLGYNVTFDWAAPVCMPFFTGAALYETFQDITNDGVDTKKLFDALMGIADPVFNLSMLDGVNSLLNVNQNSAGTNLTQVLERIASNYVTSYVPTALGAVARTIDDTRRRAYVPSGSGAYIPLYAFEQMQNKIPGWASQNIPYRNAWGEAESDPWYMRALENFLLPGYVNKIEPNALADELAKVFEDNPEATVAIPKMPQKSFTVNKETMKLTDQQWDQLTVDRGTQAKEILTELFSLPDWQTASDEDRQKMLQDAWDYSSQKAKQNLYPDYSTDKWVAEAKDPVQAILDRVKGRATKVAKSGYKDDMLKALDEEDISSYQACVAGLLKAGTKESTIKGYITTKYKAAYKQAYLTDDERTMDAIEDILDLTGFDFNVTSWEKEADREEDAKED